MQIFGIFSPLWLIYEMGWLPSAFSIGLIILGISWYFYYGKGKVVREGAIYHIFARLGQRQFQGLDSELRGILKEKGLRDYDPFDAIVAGANFIDIDYTISFEKIVERASYSLSQKLSVAPVKLKKLFMEGTQVGATPVAHGAALPHLRLPEIEHSEMVIVRCKVGTCIGLDSALFGEEAAQDLIYAFFFLASPENNPGQHLRILAQIATHVDDDTFLEKWRSAINEQDVKEVLLRDDHYLSLLLEPEKRSAELIGLAIDQTNLPEGSLIAIIHRQGDFVIPRGRIVLEAFDRLTIIGYPDGIKNLYATYVDE
jgi:APA family basic amino acid/polyamine antiporter